MVVSRRDDAISEVIGFVLILALIAIVASLYLTYVVPAQGRDLEIAHMDVIQDQFIGYKTTVDSLWINNRYNTQISSPFTLGTNPGSTQGSFVNMPLFQPVTSGGTLVVTNKDTIVVTADAPLYDKSPRSNSMINNPGAGTFWETNIINEPDHLYVSFKTTSTAKSDFVTIKPSPATNGNWEVNMSTLNRTPGVYNLLTITILKNGNSTVSNLVINNSIDTTSDYQIDLADNVYGLKESFVYPFNLTITPMTSTSITCKPTGYYIDTTGGTIFNHNMGSLEYHSSNNYWIAQNYIYQYGGVFLQQDNGTVVKLLPSITIEPVSQKLAKVTIHNITIPETIPSRVGGSSLVEVLTTLPTIDSPIIPLVTGVPNTRKVTITINARDGQTATMWKDTFKKIKQTSKDLPWIVVADEPTTAKPTTATMTIIGPSTNDNDYDIILDTQSNIANIYLSPTSYS